MLPTAFRLALRRLARGPGTTAVHVGGLAVGLACCFLALLFVRDETSYDRFHAGAERIVEVRQHVQMGDRTARFMSVPDGGSDMLRTGTTGVEAVTETHDQSGLVRTSATAEGVVTDAVRFADASFLDVFSFPLVEGDARTALAAPARAVLTETLARALFGEAEAMGRAVYLERTGFGLQDPEPVALTVTGVAEDPTTATSVGFEMLVSGTTVVAGYDGATMPVLGGDGPAYVRLASLADTVAIKAALNPLALGPDGDFTNFGARYGVFTPRLVDGHLASDGPRDGLTGRPLYLVLFLSVAGLVLLLACVNYANLATALALARATEVGVRKTLGAGRGHLVRLFLAEALVLALGAAGVAVGLVALALPTFNDFFGKAVSLGSLGAGEWATVPALGLAAGLLAGVYPALVLAGFRPVQALRGGVAQGRGGVRVRQALVVFQFAVTAVLLAATAVVGQQMSAARAEGLGAEGDRVVVLGLGAERLRQASGALKEQAEALPGVLRASLATGVPGEFNFSMVASPAATNDDPTDDVSVQFVQADANYPETFGLTMAAGRWVVPSDTSTEGDSGRIVLNETAARALGVMTTDPAEAIGKTVGYGMTGAAPTVVGVVRDFRYDGPRLAIGPLVVQPMSEYVNQMGLAVQLAAADARTVEALGGVWARVAPEYPFEPRYASDAFADALREDRQLGQLFGAFGAVAVALACLGVFGLAAHAAERRRKEIGIRKVLGATVAGIVARLSGEFARLVAVALVVAAPVAWWLARLWLEDFAYPAPLRASLFVAVGAGVLALALLAAGVQAVRAAVADPVRSLRSE